MQQNYIYFIHFLLEEMQGISYTIVNRKTLIEQGKDKGGVHMNYKEKILQLLNEIQDEEMLEFIYEIIIRLLN